MNRTFSLAVTVLVLVALLLAGSAPGLGLAHSESGGAPAAESLLQTKVEGAAAEPLTPVGGGFTYQGRLKSGGNPDNGNFDFQFRLYDAATGGFQAGPTVTVLNQAVSEGLFTVTLDFGAVDAFRGQERWLEIAVKATGGPTYTTLAPRQKLTAAPYAMSLMPGAMITNTSASTLLTLNNSGTGIGLHSITNSGFGLYGQSSSGVGMFGDGPSYIGVYGQSSSGTGVWGLSSSGPGGFFSSNTGTAGSFVSGGQFGVHARSNLTDGIGVIGLADNGSAARGVAGSSNNGVGVVGWSLTGIGLRGDSTSGEGVYAQSNSGPGVRGHSNTGTGGHFTSSNGYGVRAESSGGTGIYASGSVGIYSTGDANGVYGESSSPTGNGLSGFSGPGTGVRGESTSGAGVYGWHNDSSGTEPGVKGKTSSASPYAAGVLGHVLQSSPGSFSSGVRGINEGTGGSGIGVWGSHAGGGYGVYGTSITGIGVIGIGGSHGLYGSSNNGYGVAGSASNNSSAGVYGSHSGSGDAVYGNSTSGSGVHGTSSSGSGGVFTSGGSYGLEAASTATDGFGVRGEANIGFNASGVYGFSSAGTGVQGRSNTFAGVRAIGGPYGVYATSNSITGAALYGQNAPGNGVHGIGTVGVLAHGGLYGVQGLGEIAGIYGFSAGGYAGQFNGDVEISGNLSKGAGSFKIDHPLDPENKYLYHSFVESPDMKNIYDGVATLDAKGEAWVTMPSWFDALNRDFRYQLTSIGAPMPNLYVAEKITGNRFKIAGGRAGMEVSWQVTGTREDPYANANRIPVEEAKPEKERGTYLHSEEHGQPASKGVDYERQRHTAPHDRSTSPLPGR